MTEQREESFRQRQEVGEGWCTEMLAFSERHMYYLGRCGPTCGARPPGGPAWPRSAGRRTSRQGWRPRLRLSRCPPESNPPPVQVREVSQEERVEALRRVTEEMLTSRTEYVESTRAMAQRATRVGRHAVDILMAYHAFTSNTMSIFLLLLFHFAT